MLFYVIIYYVIKTYIIVRLFNRKKNLKLCHSTIKKKRKNMEQRVFKIFRNASFHPRVYSIYSRSSDGDVISHELTGPHMKNDARMRIRVSHGKKKKRKKKEKKGRKITRK